MKVLRLKQEAKCISDIEELEKTLKQRFKKISDKSLSKSFFLGTRVKGSGRNKSVRYSLAIYDTDVNLDVYEMLKSNFSELFEETKYG